MDSKYDYEELESFAKIIHEKMKTASETGNYSAAFADIFTEDATYKRAVGPLLPDAVAYGKDEILQIVLKEELGDIKGWRFPWKGYWIDDVQGVIIFQWEAISPWKDPDSQKYFQSHGSGYTIHFYAGNMKSNRQIDIFESRQLQYVFEEGIAAGLAGDLLKNTVKMKKRQHAIAADEWNAHLDDLRKEFNHWLIS